MTYSIAKIALSLFLASAAWAQTPPPAPPGGAHPHGPGPCEKIEADCKTAGYVAGEAGQGKGLWWDCMCPLIGNGFPEPSKNVLTVPSDGGLVPACHNHPRGAQIMNRCAEMLAKKNAKGK